MLRIKTKIHASPIEGIGLFADQFIPKGTVTWKYDQEFDPSFSEEQINSLPDFTKIQILKYGYFDKEKDVFILCADDQRFINHSFKQVNILSTPDQDVAIRDIQPGEELLCNYKDYEDDWFDRRGYSEDDFSITISDYEK